MLNIYELNGQYFIIKNDLAVFQMVVVKPSTIVLMDLGLFTPISFIDMGKTKKFSFKELKDKFML